MSIADKKTCKIISQNEIRLICNTVRLRRTVKVQLGTTCRALIPSKTKESIKFALVTQTTKTQFALPQNAG